MTGRYLDWEVPCGLARHIDYRRLMLCRERPAHDLPVDDWEVPRGLAQHKDYRMVSARADGCLIAGG